MKKCIMSYEKNGLGVSVSEVNEDRYRFFIIDKFDNSKRIKSDQCASLEKASNIFYEWIKELSGEDNEI